MDDQYLSEKELANRWKISNRTLQRWRNEGNDLPYVQIGGCIRYQLEVV